VTDLQKHRIAVVVFVDAEGVDAHDALRSAEHAVGGVVDNSDALKAATAVYGPARAVDVVAVAELNVALKMGALRMATPDQFPQS